MKARWSVYYENLVFSWRTVRTAAALSLVFVLLQVGRCQIRDTSANLHVFTHPRVRVCVRASMRRYTTILHVQIGACEVDETSTSGCVQPIFLYAGLGSKSAHLPLSLGVPGPARVQPGASRKIESHDVHQSRD